MSQAIEYDPSIFTASEEEADRTTLARFMIKSKQDMTASKKAARPVFRDVEYIEIRIAGNRTDFVCRPATYRDKSRFPRHYAAFKQRIELPEEGTPLVEWTGITRSQAEELAFFHIKTVEQLASVSDTNGQNFMGFSTLQAAARSYIQLATNTVDAQDMQDQLAKRDDEIEGLKVQVAALVAAADSAQPDSAQPDRAQNDSDQPDSEEGAEKAPVKPIQRSTRRRK